MKNLRNFKTFELRTFQKTSNKSRSDFNITKMFIGINAEIEKFSGDMHPGLAPTTHLPTHPLGFLGGWAVEKTQKNPLLCKNH
jgi:hypothetical protein